MGNWHCIPSGCAKVVYREYLPPVIRWRYEDEDWNEIEADDYAIEQEKGKCPTLYHVFGTYTSVNTDDHGCFVTGYWRTSESRFLPENFDPSNISSMDNRVGYNLNSFWYIAVINSEAYQNLNKGFAWKNRLVIGNYSECRRITSIGLGTKIEYIHLVRADGLPDDCGGCSFTVYKNDRIVHEETRDVCPQVEQLNSRLSDEQKTIEIDKFPWLERIEVVPYGYEVKLGAIFDGPDNYGFALFKEPIPDQCLNIYKNNIASTIPNDFYQIANTAENNYQLVAQICSAPNTPLHHLSTKLFVTVIVKAAPLILVR